MSLFDFRFNKKGIGETHWNGMKPPDFSIISLYSDLKWHNVLYKANKLSWRIRIFFFMCRIIQLSAYSLGWRKGLKKLKKNKIAYIQEIKPQMNADERRFVVRYDE